MVKTLRRFDFNILWNLYLMNCYMTVGIKEKERSIRGVYFYYLWEVSSNQVKIFNLPRFVFPCFPPILLIILDGLTPEF